MDPDNCAILQKKYGDCVEPSNIQKNIFRVNLMRIWESSFPDKSFPNFKRMMYSKDKSLPAELRSLWAAYLVRIDFKDGYHSTFQKIFDKFKETVKNIHNGKNYIKPEDLEEKFSASVQDSDTSKLKSICKIFIAAMDAKKVINRREEKIIFTEKVPRYFTMFKEKFDAIAYGTQDGIFYITSDKEDFDVVLGILEAMDVLNFSIEGGLNNQICIRVNKIDALEDIIDNDKKYSNKILNDMEYRYKISLEMLKYIYEGNFDSAQIWDLLEDYFLGKIPLTVRNKVS